MDPIELSLLILLMAANGFVICCLPVCFVLALEEGL